MVGRFFSHIKKYCPNYYYSAIKRFATVNTAKKTQSKIFYWMARTFFFNRTVALVAAMCGLLAGAIPLQAQHVFAPKGYMLSVKFPGEFNAKKMYDANYQLFKTPYYVASYTSKSKELKLTALFSTYKPDTTPDTRKKRQKVLHVMSSTLHKQMGGKFYMKKFYPIGNTGDGVSFTLSRHESAVPVYNMVVFIIGNKQYWFSAVMNNLEYANVVKDFMKSASSGLFKNKKSY